MSRKKEFEEKLRHGTAVLPIGLHKLEYPEGTDVIFYLHWHKEFEFLIVTKGEILFTIEDREYQMQEGDAVFINSNFLHSAKTVNGCACSFFAIDFSYQVLQEDIHSSFAKKYLSPVLNGKTSFPEFLSLRDTDSGAVGEREIYCDGIPDIGSFYLKYFQNRKTLTWQQEVIESLSDISICPEHGLEPFELMVRSRIFKVWDIMYQHSVRVKKGTEEQIRSSERLAPVVQYMKENYAYEITLPELAALIPMSEGQFCRVFKQITKMSPMQYLMRYRILQSCKLLQDTDKKIGEIANLSGFNNISYFNKVFLNIIGCTPKEYRANSGY